MTFFNVKAELEKLEYVSDDMLNQQKKSPEKKISTISTFSTCVAKKCETGAEDLPSSGLNKGLNNNNYYLSSNIKENSLINNQIKQEKVEEKKTKQGSRAKRANCANQEKEISTGLAEISTSSANLGFPNGRIKCIDCKYWKQSLCGDQRVKFPYRAHYCRNHIKSKASVSPW